MRLDKIITVIESRAPLRYKDDFDNPGLQVGDPDSDIDRILVCLDVTEAILEEAVSRRCGLIVSHHPLIFHPLKQVCGNTYQQRCVATALREGIAIYSAHTSLDNAPGGVNHRIASIIGMKGLGWLSPRPDGESGSGLIGELDTPVTDDSFLNMLKEKFGVECLLHSEPDGRTIRKVAVCGGAGAFLLPQAIAAGADCFVCGEFHYHDYFENKGVLLAELGHYQSEQWTKDLLRDILTAGCPGVEVVMTSIDTNPIRYRYAI